MLGMNAPPLLEAESVKKVERPFDCREYFVVCTMFFRVLVLEYLSPLQKYQARHPVERVMSQVFRLEYDTPTSSRKQQAFKHRCRQASTGGHHEAVLHLQKSMWRESKT